MWIKWLSHAICKESASVTVNIVSIFGYQLKQMVVIVPLAYSNGSIELVLVVDHENLPKMD